LNDAKESLFKFFFDLKEMDNWTVDEKELTELRDLVRNNLNRPKLLSQLDSVPIHPGFKYLSKLLKRSDSLDGVKRSWSILSFATISFKYIQLYDALYCKFFKHIPEFLDYLLKFSKTDALFELYFWTSAFVDARPSKKLDDVLHFIPDLLVGPFNRFFIGFKQFLQILDPEIESKMKSCMVGLF
jgi:hypothetical protein